MNKNIESWFHCGRCGSLFQSSFKHGSPHLCSKCGQNPSLDLEDKFAKSTSSLATFAPAKPAPLKARSERSSRKKTAIPSLIKFIIIWLLCLLALFGLGRMLWPEDTKDVAISENTDASTASVLSERDILVLRQAFPRCRENLIKFLDAKTTSERAELSFSPDQAIAHMAYFEGFSPMAKINSQTITHLESAVLELPVGLAVESHWKSEQGHIFSTVFIESGNEWRLDWEHFAQFSDGSWPLFLAGSGPPEGAFRLLARERLTDDRETSVIRMTLYAASSGNSHQTGSPSPEFTVPRDTRNGRLLDAAFKLARSNKLPFGVKLPLIDPEGMIRVRVKIRRVQESDSRRFELVSVIACHWYSTVEPGVEIVDQPLAK